MTSSLRRRAHWAAASLVLSLGSGALAQGVTPRPVPAPATTGSRVLAALTPAERDLLLSLIGVSEADQFLVGQLAPNLPFPLPALAGQAVVGTVVRPDQTNVIVRTTLGEDAAYRAAQDTLRAAGWQPLYPSGGVQVFQRAGVVREYSPLCKPGVRGQLMVNAFEGPRGTQVNYQHARFTPESSCPATPGPADGGDNFYFPRYSGDTFNPYTELEKSGVKLPSLPPLPGSEVGWNSTTFGQSEFTAYANVTAPQDTAAVAAHYVSALKAQGWQAVDTRVIAGQSVSRFVYRVGDRELQGTLSLKPRPELDRTEGGTRQQRQDIRLQMELPALR